MKINYSNKKMKSRLHFIVTATILFISNSVFAYCPPQYQEQWVYPYFTASTQTVNQAVNTVDAALSAQLQLNSQRLTSAIAVLTKQKALAAHQISDGSRTVALQTATALNTLAQTERVKAARFEYGGEFGQGYSPCKVQTSRQNISSRDADMAAEVRVRVKTEVLAAPGNYEDPIKARRTLINNREEFCTQDQFNSGMCKRVGTLPGADLTAATLFEPAMEGEQLYDAKVAFINNAVGLPDGAISKSAGKSAAASSYALAKSRKDAFISPAITSLKQIQLDYSGVEGNETGRDLPLAMHFANEVKRYSGNSEEYDAWSRVMVAQNERGALVELLKIQALKLAIQEKHYRQYERMEAQLAILVAMETQAAGMKESVEQVSNTAISQTVYNQIQ